MKMAPMRFDGISLRHNPEKLVLSDKNHIHEYRSPCCVADSSSLGKELRVITGEGEFVGQDCQEQYVKLLRLYNSGKRSKLVLPRMQPMYAYLKAFSVTAQPKENVLRYRFEFVQAQSPRPNRQTAIYYVTSAEAESLWDIAYAYDVPVEQLVALNPRLPYIDRLNKGERVTIC